MPCRSAAPEVAIRYPAAARAPTTVGPVQPGEGCAATPTGLSTTTRSSSSWTMRRPGTGSGGVCSTGAAGPGSSTSSHPPATSRSDFPSSRPSSVTWPSAASSAARVRDRPNRRARPASTRSPSRPSGTGSERSSNILVDCFVLSGGGAVAVDGDVDGRNQDEEDGAGHDPDVRDVPDEPAVVVDEVEHLAARHTGRPEQSVRQVAERRGPGTRAQSARDPDDCDDDGERDQGEDPRRSGGEGEGSPGIADQVQSEEPAEHRRSPPGAQARQRPLLGRLVSDEHREGDQGENGGE